MRRPVVMITGANGELGHELIRHLAREGAVDILALDVRALDVDLSDLVLQNVVGDILDADLLQRVVAEYEVRAIYHLAALLSTRAEYTPAAAHNVNVNGTLNLLQLAHDQAQWHGHRVPFIFPSSIAIYGLPSIEQKRRGERLKEHDWNVPTTMYGCNKLYCEQLGRYYTCHYQQLASERSAVGVDFRALRYPGLISAFTTPSGGTSDYAPEMVHAAARGEEYRCFVAPEESLPFMIMPDAIRALLRLGSADHERLSLRAYNVTSFSLTAGEIAGLVRRHFPRARISFQPDPQRAAIVATWPADVDDTAARADWGWKPAYDAERAFEEYLVPNIRSHYQA